MLRVALVLIGMVAVARADAPSGYACSPGTINKGVGCTCPANHREKRDTENIALCAAKPTATAAQQLLAMLDKNNLAGAIEQAKKFDFNKDTKTLQAVFVAFSKSIKPVKEQMDLAAQRGQCSLVSKQLAGAEQWFKLFITMGSTGFKGKEFEDDMMAVYTDKLDEVFAPLRSTRTACIATASKDDGSAAIKAAYDANKAALAKCFDGVPAPKAPMTAKVVVDADGAVADVTLGVTWPDLDVKLVNARLEMVRLEEIMLREKCFLTAITGWKLKPNARGFAATITVTK